MLRRSVLVLGLGAMLSVSVAVSARSQTATPPPMSPMATTPAASPMAGMMEMSVDAPAVPAVVGYAEGAEIHFIHPEASDPAIAQSRLWPPPGGTNSGSSQQRIRT